MKLWKPGVRLAARIGVRRTSRKSTANVYTNDANDNDKEFIIR